MRIVKPTATVHFRVRQLMSTTTRKSNNSQLPFQGRNKKARLEAVPVPPPWRSFTAEAKMLRGKDFQLGVNSKDVLQSEDVKLVNAALILRRPLLVTGRPGTGKSTLAHAIDYELDLGGVLVWPITTRSTLQAGLYAYDAIGRLQDASMKRAVVTPRGKRSRVAVDHIEIGKYIRLGPLGTALLPSDRPRVLLIDEIDKSDIDLPNDLLYVFEEGEFEIPELSRLPNRPRYKNIYVSSHDSDTLVGIERGRVRCTTFPLVILTSNGEREFPPAFLRRCLRLEIKQPTFEELKQIVTARLKSAKDNKDVESLIELFVDRRDGLKGGDKQDLATDQLLNAVHLLLGKYPLDETLRDAVLRPLGGSSQ